MQFPQLLLHFAWTLRDVLHFLRNFWSREPASELREAHADGERGPSSHIAHACLLLQTMVCCRIKC